MSTNRSGDVRTMVEQSLLEQFIRRTPRMKPGSWGRNGKRFCMMSALVTGARSAEDCVTAGWPAWFSYLVPSLYDGGFIGFIGTSGILNVTANEWAHEVVKRAVHPIDYAAARDHVIQSLLKIIGSNPNPRTKDDSVYRRILYWLRVSWFAKFAYSDISGPVGELMVAERQARYLGLHRSHPGLDYANYLVDSIPDNPMLPIVLYALIGLEYGQGGKKMHAAATARARQAVLDAMDACRVAPTNPVASVYSSDSAYRNTHDPLHVLIPQVSHDHDGHPSQGSQEARV